MLVRSISSTWCPVIDPLIVLAAIGFGGYLLFARKSAPSAKVPGPGRAAVKVTYRNSEGQQDALEFPPVNLELLNDAEMSVLQTGTADDIYNEASGSNHMAFVRAAAARLATMNDPRAFDLITQTIGDPS